LEGWKAALLEKEDASNDSEGFVVPTQVLKQISFLKED